MTYPFPADVQHLIEEQMAGSGYRSEDDLLRDALRLFREFRVRQEQLLSELQVGIDQANQGLSRPLDVEALIERCTAKLAEEGIVD